MITDMKLNWLKPLFSWRRSVITDNICLLAIEHALPEHLPKFQLEWGCHIKVVTDSKSPMEHHPTFCTCKSSSQKFLQNYREHAPSERQFRRMGTSRSTSMKQIQQMSHVKDSCTRKSRHQKALPWHREWVLWSVWILRAPFQELIRPVRVLQREYIYRWERSNDVCGCIP